MLNLLTETKYIDNNILDNRVIEESYFSSAIQFVKEMNNEYRDASKNLYINILESENNVYVINESFGGFFNKVKEIIDKFLKFIKSLFERFVAFLHKLIGSDKYILKHKKEFSKFDSDDTFTYDVFKYSFDNDIPVASIVSFTIDEYVDGVYELLAKIKDKANDDYTKIKTMINSEINRLSEGLEDSLSESRGVIIGKDNESIDSTDYADELYKVFRSGEDIKDNIEITKADVSDCLLFFENYQKFIIAIKKNKKSLESEYNKVSKSIEKMARTNELGQLILSSNQEDKIVDYINKTDNADIISLVNTYNKNASKFIMDISNAHSLAFGAKLDAAKECYKQDRAILYKAYSKIIKNHRN